VFNKNFIESSYVFNIYLLILITRFIFSRIILIGFKDTKPILYSSLVEIIINVALSFSLIKLWGIYGVAIATFLSYVIEKIILVRILNKKYNILLKQYVNVKKLYLFSAILLICWILGWYI
jgi:Na+-driven multidrug efflux pump